MELICGLNVRQLFRMIGTGMIPGVLRDQFGRKPDSVLCLGKRDNKWQIDFKVK
jgi:hypothetical protein